MTRNQHNVTMMQIDDTFMANWFSEEFSLVTGLYQLTYDGHWHCTFASDACFEILKCTDSDFLERLRALPALTSYGTDEEVSSAEKTVGSLLQEMITTQRSGSFITIHPCTDGVLQYIKGTLAVSRSRDGLLCVYGQITDVSGEKSKDVHSQINQQIFQIVAQHSNRTLYAYDLATGVTRPWDAENQKKDILAHLYTGHYSDERLERNAFVLPDSTDDVKEFFGEIHRGVPSGEANIHVKMTDGQFKWYHFKFSSIFDKEQPVTALISIEDVTERHEHEIAYRRHVQSLEADAEKQLLYIESDLTADRIEHLTGQLLSEEDRQLQCSHSDFGPLMQKNKLHYEDVGESARYFSCENLLAHYNSGERQLESEWKVRFSDDTIHWLNTETTLMADPYNGHVKAFFRMVDITEEYEDRLSVLQRADFDAMTGLLRKDAGEERIKNHMSSTQEEGGVLILLDLDDLKDINDSLGHKQGDAAIIGISDILKGHFRKSDIVLRAGGDEFIVFLPNAAESVSSVELSMSALLRKLSGLFVGEDNERNIHCSAGCAVEISGTDTYDTLFKRADVALYHVKRHGKNNFAFYEPEMTDINYEFKANVAVPVVNEALKKDSMLHLLEVVSAHYPGLLLFNLSKNCYWILSINSDASNLPPSGDIDLLWKGWVDYIHPKDRTDMVEKLSRSNLLASYAKGERRIQYRYRNIGSWGDFRMEASANFFRTEAGDICAFLFIRRDTAPEKERELLRLQKVIELTIAEDIEYICLIDVHNKSYSTFSRDSLNSHTVPEIADFDLATKHIRDTQIAPEERDSYYAHAALDQVLLQMKALDNRYSYRYTMLDGITRKAAFSWYEESHSELLMTIRKLP